MAHAALRFWVVGMGIYPGYIGPAAGGSDEGGMTPQAELPALVYGEGGRVFGMVQGRAVTVFTGDDPVGGAAEAYNLVSVALLAVRDRPVFNCNSFPLVFIPFAMPAVHVPLFVDAKVIRHQEDSGNEDQNYQGYGNKERPPDETTHGIFPSLSVRLMQNYCGASVSIPGQS